MVTGIMKRPINTKQLCCYSGNVIALTMVHISTKRLGLASIDGSQETLLFVHMYATCKFSIIFSLHIYSLREYVIVSGGLHGTLSIMIDG